MLPRNNGADFTNLLTQFVTLVPVYVWVQFFDDTEGQWFTAAYSAAENRQSISCITTIWGYVIKRFSLSWMWLGVLLSLEHGYKHMYDLIAQAVEKVVLLETHPGLLCLAAAGCLPTEHSSTTFLYLELQGSSRSWSSAQSPCGN